MNNQNIAQDLKELYYTQVYSEGAFGSSSMPAASADAATQAANTHRTAADAASTPEDRRRHRDSAARYEVTARRMSMTADHYEFLVGYLINENYASDLDSALVIIENMSDNWIESIFEENLNEVSGFGKVLFRGLQAAARRGMRVDPETKAYVKQANLEDKLEILKQKYHDTMRGVKKAPKFNDTPEAQSLNKRIQRIDDVRQNTSN